MNNIKIISAGAGSGKTYSLTEQLVNFLGGDIRPSGIIATTFTKKAAAELQERVRVKLLERGMAQKANEMAAALIGTVHGVGVQLLRRFAFEAGVSPMLDIMSDDDRQLIFNNALATTMNTEVSERMNDLCKRLGLSKKEEYDWRSNINQLVDIARANNLTQLDLDKSKKLSFETLQQYLGEKGTQTASAMKPHIEQLLMETITALEDSGDETKVTADGINELRSMHNDLRTKGQLFWYQWAKIGKVKVSAKRNATIEPLREMAAKHTQFTDFHGDIEQYISLTFELVAASLIEFEQYKKQRGIIDYTDMELLVLQLLENEAVCDILREEIDLLIVDEFQDTSPIQLEIFLKLSKIAKQSVWVGDPKQSIYGFRGADPKIMNKIVEVYRENMETLVNSYRSRPDIVNATNAIFIKAFPEMQPPQIVLNPTRKDEPDMSNALKVWYFQLDSDNGKGTTDAIWLHNSIATTLKKNLDAGMVVLDKETKTSRMARPGDAAILCRSNSDCIAVANALHKAGLKAAISRNGLLETQEIRLLLACLRYILSASDSLSVAEIMVLGSKKSTAEMLDSRMKYLRGIGDTYDPSDWGKNENALIDRLDALRPTIIEYSGSVILDLILDELDLRRDIIALGNATQRLDNVEVLRHFARQYEDNCHRLHSASSLGGMILWIGQLPDKKKDNQASAESHDAVQVMTYHRSKGLEWPIVVCHSLESNVKDSIWGSSMVSEGDIDLDNVLKNRWLRFWVQPYGDQLGKTQLEQNISQSIEQQQVTADALAEDARILYVGITRARDYLVLPMREKKAMEWLDRTCTPGATTVPAFDVYTGETSWQIGQKMLSFEHSVDIFPKIFASIPASNHGFPYFKDRAGQKSYSPFFIKADTEDIESKFRYEIGEELRYGNGLQHHESVDKAQVITYLTALQNADNQLLSQSERNGLAQQLFAAMQLNDVAFDLNDALQSSTDFYDYLYQNLGAESIQTQQPLRDFFESRCFETTLDFKIQVSGSEYIIIQNMNYGGNNRLKRVKTLRNWAYYVQKSLFETNKQLENVSFYINFAAAGILVELKIFNLD